jgi:hypothetical protein
LEKGDDMVVFGNPRKTIKYCRLKMLIFSSNFAGKNFYKYEIVPRRELNLCLFFDVLFACI